MFPWIRAVYYRWLAVALFLFSASNVAIAQSTNATLTGIVVDSTGAALRGADLLLMDLATAVPRRGVSGGEGAFTFTGLMPGRFSLRVSLAGFAPTELRDIVLNVDDRISIRVQMAVAAIGEAVTVVAEPPRISTSPSVSTVIDRKFVENLPLNGRSFQSLLELTAGVVLVPAGGPPTVTGNGGQFSVNGQRASANNFTVDGVSANVGMMTSVSSVAMPGQAGAGQLPGFSAQGGTSSMVSVDGLQEFRIQTSTFAPEFGRTPGGQISLVTRAGSNVLHGSVYEFFRDDALDATDWFVNNRGQPRARMSQHDFGGVLGGPLLRGRLFFFGSYEGLRLELPRARVQNVPSLEFRRTASADVQPYVNAFPLPNGRDLGNGFAEFNQPWSDPSRSDTTSVRLDQRAGNGISFFGRLNVAPSFNRSRSLAYTSEAHADNIGVTLGSTWVPSPRVVYDIRANYTTNDAPYILRPDDFGGATPLPETVFAPGRDPSTASFQLIFGTVQSILGTGTNFTQRSLNVLGSVSAISGPHELKFGIDFRRANPVFSNRSRGGGDLAVDLCKSVHRSRLCLSDLLKISWTSRGGV